MKKCINKRCNCELQEDFAFCPYCGKSQSSKTTERRRTKGTGSIYYRKDKKQILMPLQAVLRGKGFI